MLGLKQHVRLQIDAEYVGLVIIRIEIERLTIDLTTSDREIRFFQSFLKSKTKKKPKKEEDRNFQNFPVENAR